MRGGAISEVAVSLNLLYGGFKPSKPLHLEINESDSPIGLDRQGLDVTCGMVRPVSAEPIAVDANGSPIVAAVVSCKGDWKAHKDSRVS